MGRLFRKVPKQVGLSLVAAAVARDNFLRTARELRLDVYGAQEGSSQGQMVLDAAELVAIALHLCAKAGEGEGVSVMKGGLSALVQCSERRFEWRARDAVAVELALSRAAEHLRLAKPSAVRDAWAHVNEHGHV